LSHKIKYSPTTWSRKRDGNSIWTVPLYYYRLYLCFAKKCITIY